MMNMETIVMHTNYDPNRTLDCVRRLISLQVPGVAVMTSELESSASKILIDNGICAVYMDLAPWAPGPAKSWSITNRGFAKPSSTCAGSAIPRSALSAGPLSLQSVQRAQAAFIEKMPAEFARPLTIIDSDGTFQGGYFLLLQAAGLHQPDGHHPAPTTWRPWAPCTAPWTKGINVPRDLFDHQFR